MEHIWAPSGVYWSLKRSPMNSFLFPILSSEHIEKSDKGERDEEKNIILFTDEC